MPCVLTSVCRANEQSKSGQAKTGAVVNVSSSCLKELSSSSDQMKRAFVSQVNRTVMIEKFGTIYGTMKPFPGIDEPDE